MRKFIYWVMATTMFALTYSAHAQNWQLINSKYENAFTFNYSHGFLGDFYNILAIDSISINGADTSFYPIVGMDPYKAADSCKLIPFQWIGHKITQDDHSTTFYNKKGDSILINYKVNLNDSWVTTQFDDSSYVQATVTSIHVDSLFDITDSMATIELMMKNKFDSTVSHLINGTNIKISKSYGLVEAPNFYFFPDTVDIHSLKGSSNGKKGVQNMNALSIYNYSAGDLFHIREHYASLPAFGNDFTTNYIKDSIVNVDITGDTIFITHFTETKTFKNESSPFYDPIWSQGSSTYTEKVNHKTNKLNLRSFEQSIKQEGAATQYLLNSNEPRMVKRTVFHIIQKPDTCWVVPYDYEQESNYYECAGGPYYSRSYFSISERWLWYQKSGDGKKEFGTPFDFETLSINESAFLELNAFPNPVTDQLNITSKYPIVGTLEIYNVLGQPVVPAIQLQGAQIQFSIPFGNLTSGIYSIRILNKDRQLIQSMKVVKE